MRDDMPHEHVPARMIPKPPKVSPKGFTQAMRLEKRLKENPQAVLIRHTGTIPMPARRMVNLPGPKRSGLVTVQLHLRHSINGRTYGPGIVKCLPDQAAQFLSTESLAQDKELALVQQRAYIVKFVDGCPVKHQVPWAQFDSIMGGQAVPLETMGG